MTEETLQPLHYAITHFDAETSEVKSDVQNKISDVDLARFVETDTLKKVLCEDLNYEATKDTICSLAEDNEIFSNHAANVLVELVLRRQIESTMQTNKQPQDLDILPHLFVTLSALMAVKDSLRHKRIEKIMPQLIKVFKFNMKSASQADYAMRWLLSEAHSLEEIRDWLLGHLDAWLLDLLISSPFDSVRKGAEEMVRVIVRQGCVVNHDAILKPLLDLLPVCAKHAGPAADKVIARKANSPKTKSWKLASYFRLLKVFTKTKEHKMQCASNWSKLRKLLKLIIDEEKDNDLELNNNKKFLCELLYHLVTDCPANLHIICDDIEAMARVLDCFINLRGLPETVAYNETMIPLGYKLVTLCVKRNPSFIPQVLLPNHHTFEWSILKFCQSTKYPKSSQALFEFLQKVVEHPDMDSWRQRRIKAALVDDNDNPFSHNPHRLLTLFDALIRTERDGQVFCDNDGLNILHRFMQQFKENPGVDPEQETLVCNLAALVISKAQRGDLRLKKEKEARATRAREELLALLDEEEDTAKRKKQRSKRKRNRQKRQRQQQKEAAKQSKDLSPEMKTSRKVLSSDQTSSTSNSNGKSDKHQQHLNGKTKTSSTSTSTSTSITSSNHHNQTQTSNKHIKKSTKHFDSSGNGMHHGELLESLNEKLEEMKGPESSNHMYHTSHSSSYPHHTPLSHSDSSLTSQFSSTASNSPSHDPVSGNAYGIHETSLSHQTQPYTTANIGQNHFSNHHEISPTSSHRNSTADHRRRDPLTINHQYANDTHSTTSSGVGQTSLSSRSSPASSPLQTPLSNQSHNLNPHLPLNSGADVPVPVKPPSVTTDILSTSSSGNAANGWHTVTNTQHKLQKDNKKLQQEIKNLRKDATKLRNDNKSLQDLLDQLQKDHDSGQIDLETIKKQESSHVKEISDLKLQLKETHHKYETAMTEFQKHRIQDPAKTTVDDEARFQDLTCHTDQELQSMSDGDLDSLAESIFRAKDVLRQESDALEIAAEMVGRAKTDRSCLICSRRLCRSEAVLFLPCQHKNVCKICYTRIAKCPVCQQDIQEKILPGELVVGLQSNGVTINK